MTTDRLPGGELTWEYPADLPVSARHDDIMAALAEHQVVIVAGETGSGKTTQLPKMALAVGLRHNRESGSGLDTGEVDSSARATDRPPRIAHTQPRRIAARAVAERIAEELNVPLGSTVGYRVRFTDETSDDTLLTVMTDGLLLASIRQDRLLRGYDTIIVDEAHERSLSIDFLLGYLAWLLPQRPDLRVIVTSATLETSRFAEHFGDAPVIEVSGRTYPVEIRYRPREDADTDEVDAVCDAVDELLREPPGDILVFLSGEREIRDALDALRGRVPAGTELLPLYGRLTAHEQHRVFAPHTGRRVVLSTNVAETSLTVPGIRYVVDTGTARISRFSTRAKVQRLPIEPISQASATQRAGRCGRVADGICIRLYDEADFASRPAYTDPEILRTNLSAVLLQMATLGLGEIDDFPFLDPPERKAVAAGIAVLEEIGAVRKGREPLAQRVTEIGRRLARMPLDPRLGRMVLAAEELGCVEDVIVLAAALSIRDPRERPDERASLADAAHKRFIDPTSDLLTTLNLWDYLEESQRGLSSTKFRAMCRTEFIHYLRVREWQDLVGQIRGALRLKRTKSGDRDSDAIHRAVLTGHLAHVGMKEKVDDARRQRRPEYHGARDTRFAIWPGSALAGANPEWVMAAELVETGRLWARRVARIDPAWVEEAAGDLAIRAYSEPLWSSRQARATCRERVTVLGLPVVAGRTIPYAHVDEPAARELFIRHALVRNEWRHKHRELERNAAALDEIREGLVRSRLPEDSLNEDLLVDFYAERIGRRVTSGRTFDAWWLKARQRDRHLLDLPPDVLEALGRPAPAEFPGEWPGTDLSLSYQFSPGDPRDGVTVRVPVALLPTLADDAFAAHVPGFREDMVIALLRGLPKELRRQFGPAPDAAARLIRGMEIDDVRGSLSRAARSQFDIVVSPAAWPFDTLPDHLRVLVSVLDDSGREIDADRSVADVRQRLSRQAASAVRRSAPQFDRRTVTEWPDFVPEVTTEGVSAYPCLVAEDDGSVSLVALPTRADQDRLMARGVARLLRLVEPLRAKDLRLSDTDKLMLARNPQGSVRALLEECAETVALEVIAEAGGAPMIETEFASVRTEFRQRQAAAVRTLLLELVPIMETWWAVSSRLDEAPSAALQRAWDDVRAQIDDLMSAGAVLRTGRAGLPDLLRYLRAAQRRLDALPGDAARDLLRMEQVQRLESAFADLPADARRSPEGSGIRQTIEELRVSLWAQDLGTARSVSEQRISRAIAALRA